MAIITNGFVQGYRVQYSLSFLFLDMEVFSRFLPLKNNFFYAYDFECMYVHHMLQKPMEVKRGR